jgi:hypothetical protein
VVNRVEPKKRRLPVAVAVVISFCAAFGLTKGMFALHLLASTTIFGTTLGPYPITVLSLVDAIVGLAVALAGIALIFRKQRALELLRQGWLPLISYEVGRALGMSSVSPMEVRAYDVLMKIVLLVCLLIVWTCLRRPSLLAYAK